MLGMISQQDKKIVITVRVGMHTVKKNEMDFLSERRTHPDCSGCATSLKASERLPTLHDAMRSMSFMFHQRGFSMLLMHLTSQFTGTLDAALGALSCMFQKLTCLICRLVRCRRTLGNSIVCQRIFRERSRQ